MNMKAILNPKFQKDIVTVIEYSSSDEYLQAVDKIYHTKDPTLAKIQEELMHTTDLIKKFCKGKQKVVEFEVGSGLMPLEIDEVLAHLEMMESISEVGLLKKSFQSFKEKNRYLND